MKRLLITLSALLMFTGTKAQIANAGFETWDSVSSAYYPSQWPLLTSAILERTTDAFSGNYALEVSVWYYYTETMAVQAAPINYKPLAFCGWYKYTGNIIKNQTTGLVTDDTAFAEVYLTKWNATASVTDTVGRGRIELLGTNTYQHFTCPVNYTSTEMPDTVIVVMDPSMMRNGGNYFSEDTTGYNSYLKMDDLYLQRWTTNVADINSGQLRLYPNPAADYIDLDMAAWGAATYSIADVAGRVVKTQAVSGCKQRISLQNLPAGPYVISVTEHETNTTVTQTFIHQ